ncbi:hypothetical protein ACWM3R_001467 [Vibrio cholerae]
MDLSACNQSSIKNETQQMKNEGTQKNRFYKTSPHGGVGSNVSFHAINGGGYVTNIDLAHIYTRDEAQDEVNKGWLRSSTSEELFLSVDHVDELSIWKVDCQHVKLSYPENTDPKDEYVLYRKGCWDGNDLGFASKLSHSFDYSKARVFNGNELKQMDTEGWVVVPKFHCDEIARRTFEEVSINRKKMISCAGIVGIRKKRKSKTNGKTKFNCPECGKIVWQYDPYDFQSCTDILCKRYDGYMAGRG